MEINTVLIKSILNQSKSRVLKLMDELSVPKNDRLAKFYHNIDCMDSIIEGQKKYVRDNMDKIYDEFFNAICDIAKTLEDCVIKLFICHPNMWNDDSNNCFFIITENIKNIGIDDRVKIYDNVYPTGIGNMQIKQEDVLEFEFQSSPYTGLLNKGNQQRSPEEIIKQLKAEISEKCQSITYNFDDK